MGIEAIELTVTAPLALEEAFARFTAGLAGWWPAEYTWSQAALETIAMEPGKGGFCYEVGPHGFRCDWGRVLAWEPPYRLLLTWQISPRREPVPDPAQASEVEVRFQAECPTATRVTLRHGHLERHGEGAEAYREMMASAQGWAYILERYVKEGL